MPANLSPATEGIAMNGIKWLRCTASSGQFKDELALHGRDYQEEEFSLFTARKFVKMTREPSVAEEVDALLQVVVLDKQGSLCLVRLPGQTLDNGSTITVRDEQLDD